MEAWKPYAHVIDAFPLEGEPVEWNEIHAGNINGTYYLRTTACEYILQSVNTYVFKDPEALMRNIQLVTEYLGTKVDEAEGEVGQRVLKFIPSKAGGLLYPDAQGKHWRVCYFVRNAVAYNSVEKRENFVETGRAFGKFQRMLADFPAAQLTETIPNFHNTRKRFFTFCRSVEADAAGRVKEVEDIIDEMFDRRKAMCRMVEMIESGEIPLRVTHNDTKTNNVLLDADTGAEKCVIDLDTVMPGAAAYDFGDAIRFGANTAAEDEPDTSKVSLDLDLFKAFCEGFVAETAGVLTRNEILNLPLGVRVITTEQVIRFLTDYLDGDVYFKVRYPLHNLVRARAQLTLLHDIEKKYDEMCAIVRQIAGEE